MCSAVRLLFRFIRLVPSLHSLHSQARSRAPHSIVAAPMDTINSSESHQQVVSTPDRLSSSITHDSYSLDDEAAQEFEHAHDHNKATAELPRDIQPVRVTVDRLSVWVRPSKLQQWLQGARVDDEQRGTLILNNIRAILEPGKLIAIMGASGSLLLGSRARSTCCADD